MSNRSVLDNLRCLLVKVTVLYIIIFVYQSVSNSKASFSNEYCKRIIPCNQISMFVLGYLISQPLTSYFILDATREYGLDICWSNKQNVGMGMFILCVVDAKNMLFFLSYITIYRFSMFLYSWWKSWLKVG
jgi:hypothetical protein